MLSWPTPTADALQTVADRAREVAGADVAWVVTGSDPGARGCTWSSGCDADLGELQRRADARVALWRAGGREGEPIAVEDLGAESRAVDLVGALGLAATRTRRSSCPSVAGASRGRAGPGLDPDRAMATARLDAELPASFAEQATLALQVARAREDQSGSPCSRIATGSAGTCTTW